MADNKQIAADVLEAVGGKSNVSFVTHCMTRLRFTLKDRTRARCRRRQKDQRRAGCSGIGGQFQVIIGQNVPKVYDELCAMGGFAKQAAIDENLDAPAEKLTPSVVGKRIMNYLAGSMTPMIPVLLAAGLFKTVGVVLGPTMMGVLAADSDVVRLMDMIYNAAFYFMPIYLGYNASQANRPHTHPRRVSGRHAHRAQFLSTRQRGNRVQYLWRFPLHAGQLCSNRTPHSADNPRCLRTRAHPAQEHARCAADRLHSVPHARYHAAHYALPARADWLVAR